MALTVSTLRTMRASPHRDTAPDVVRRRVGGRGRWEDLVEGVVVVAAVVVRASGLTRAVPRRRRARGRTTRARHLPSARGRGRAPPPRRDSLERAVKDLPRRLTVAAWRSEDST